MNRLLIFTALVAWCACIPTEHLRRMQYDADYQQALQLCGRADAAFQSGYNAGYGGGRMSGDWTAMCVPAVQQQTFAAYQSGFLQGANNAPIHVVHTVAPGRPMIAPAPVAQCTFDSDCGGDGYHCRDHTCMGYGGIGDRCVFNEDCANDHCFGGTCRE